MVFDWECSEDVSLAGLCLTRLLLTAEGVVAVGGFVGDREGDALDDSVSSSWALDLDRFSDLVTGWKRPGTALKDDGWLAIESIFLNSAM